MKQQITYTYKEIPKIEAFMLIDAVIDKDIQSIDLYREISGKDLYRLDVTINRRNEDE